MRANTTDGQHPPLLRVGLLCAAIAVFIRCAWFWSVKDAAFLYAHVQDAALYHELAVTVMSDGLPLDAPFNVAPLYGLFLASIYAVAGVDPTAVYALQIAIAGVTTFLTARLGARVFGQPGAWAGGLVTALYPVAIIYDVRLLSVGLGSFLFIAAASLIHRAWVKPRGRMWLTAGVVLWAGGVGSRQHVDRGACHLCRCALARGAQECSAHGDRVLALSRARHLAQPLGDRRDHPH